MLVGSICISALSAVVAASSPGHESSSPVNVIIGTTNGGNVFLGATLPYGSAKAGADAIGSNGRAGSVSDGSPISGISQFHDDGTGGGSSLSNFKILPVYCDIFGHGKTCITNETTRALSHGPISASPGYFSISLAGSISAEMTVTQHAALHYITYHDVFASGPPALLVDPMNDGVHSFSNGSIQIVQLPSQGHHRRVVNETAAGPANATAQESYKEKPHFNGVRVTGSGNFKPSFGQGNYNVYFCLDAPGVSARATYTNDDITSATRLSPPSGSHSERRRTSPTRPLHVPPISLDLRIGVSFLSTAQACSYAQNELPDLSEHGFSATNKTARAKWNDVLWTVQVNTFGVAHAVIERLWSSLYRTYIASVNVTGDNPLWESAEPYYDSFYCIWDSFRVVHPLYAITQPTTQSEMVRALVDIYRHLGWLPDCRMSLSKGYTQGGSNADTLLVDSYLKGIQGVEWGTAFEAVFKDATVQPPDWNLNGRNGLKSRTMLHYVPKDDTTDPTSGGAPDFSASHTLEYAYNDFSIALLAKGLGKQDEYAQYLNGSRDWENIWDASIENTGFTVFIQARFTNGSFAHVDPRRCSPVLGTRSATYGGAMGAFVVWSSLGLFPVAGQPVYLLSALLFPSISITNPDTGAAAHIVTRGFDGARRNRYVQSATLDGRPYTRNWIDHGLFARGGILELVLGPKPSGWGTREADLPLSVSTGGY